MKYQTAYRHWFLCAFYLISTAQEALAGPCSPPPQPRGFRFEGLGIPAHPIYGMMTSSEAIAVSRNGRVIVGTSRDLFGASTAFVWREGHGSQALSLPDTTDTIAKSVSGDGNVIALAPWTEQETYLYSSNAQPTRVGQPGELLRVNALNRNGRAAVGYTAPQSRAFLWRQATGTRLLNLPAGAIRSLATDISANGRSIVGYTWQSIFGGPTRAAVWNPDGTVEQIPLLPGDVLNRAVATSKNGRIVIGLGGQTVLDPSTTLFRYDRDTHELTHLGPGMGIRGCGGRDCAVIVSGNSILTAETGNVELESLLSDAGALIPGWSGLEIQTVSDNGHWIIGDGLNPQGLYEAWRARIPSPARIAEFLMNRNPVEEDAVEGAVDESEAGNIRPIATPKKDPDPKVGEKIASAKLIPLDVSPLEPTRDCNSAPVERTESSTRKD